MFLEQKGTYLDETQGCVGAKKGTVADSGGHGLIFVPVCITVD